MELKDVLQQPVMRRRDLVAAGMSERTLRRRVADGLFVRVGPGLLTHRGLAELPATVDLAAQMWSGDPLTGPSAARLFPPGPVAELVPWERPWLLTDRRGSFGAVRLGHPRPEVVRRRGLLIASPRQSALDCLRHLPEPHARDLAFRCAQQKLLSAQDLTSEAEILRHRHGAPQLRRLARVISTNAHAESEVMFHRRLRRAGITGWVANLWVRTDAGSVCIDIAFAAHKLAIEFDSPVTHAAPQRFRNDRRKWNALKRAGWQVLNYTWDSITQAWQETAAEIRHFLRRAEISA